MIKINKIGLCMAEAPIKIKEVFDELKKSYGGHIELKFLNKRFCVFEATSKWDSKRKKPVKITHYIGWGNESKTKRERKRCETARKGSEEVLRGKKKRKDVPQVLFNKAEAGNGPQHACERSCVSS